MTIPTEPVSETEKRLRDIEDWLRAVVAPRFMTALSHANYLTDLRHSLQSRRSSDLEVERMREALNRYRYAIAWTSADAWDHCGDCRERLEWARTMDSGGHLDVNEVAAVGKVFLARTALSTKEGKDE